jgi:FMN-dependent NADH-azoreductase
MGRILYIQASPRGGWSESIKVADAFVTAYRRVHPADTVETLNVFQADLPPFDGLTVRAKYTILHGQEHTEDELASWRAVEAVIERFKTADKYVFAVPMWNFSVPYRLKHYIDVLVQPGYTFSYSPAEGYKGLLSGRPVFIAYASSGEYSGPAGEAMDLQSRYMKLILNFIGLTDLRSVTVAPTLAAGPEAAQKAMAKAIQEAQEMAESF